MGKRDWFFGFVSVREAIDAADLSPNNKWSKELLVISRQTIVARPSQRLGPLQERERVQRELGWPADQVMDFLDQPRVTPVSGCLFGAISLG